MANLYQKIIYDFTDVLTSKRYLSDSKKVIDTLKLKNTAGWQLKKGVYKYARVYVAYILNIIVHMFG